MLDSVVKQQYVRRGPPDHSVRAGEKTTAIYYLDAFLFEPLYRTVVTV